MPSGPVSIFSEIIEEEGWRGCGVGDGMRLQEGISWHSPSPFHIYCRRLSLEDYGQAMALFIK
jgi:hypothetical protein